MIGYQPDEKPLIVPRFIGAAFAFLQKERLQTA